MRTQRNRKLWWFITGAVVIAIFAVLLGIQLSSNKHADVLGVKNGQPAPQFSLQSTAGQISLTQYKKKNVVVFFYESNSCSACIDQLKQLNAELGEFKKLNTMVIAVTTDSLALSEQQVQQNHIQIPVAYDPNHELGSKFGVYNVPGGMDMGPVDTHSIFVIDGNGVLRWHQISTQSMHIPVQSVIVALKKL